MFERDDVGIFAVYSTPGTRFAREHVRVGAAVRPIDRHRGNPRPSGTSQLEVRRLLLVAVQEITVRAGDTPFFVKRKIQVDLLLHRNQREAADRVSAA